VKRSKTARSRPDEKAEEQKRKPAVSGKYRNPPAKHRYKPGESGNPNGRPKKKASFSFDPANAGVLDRNEEVLLDVAARPIVVREGDKTETISGLEALYRSMLRNAAQGDSATGRILVPLIAKAESKRAAQEAALFQRAEQHLRTWNPIFYERELQGLPPPEVYPHPADIEFNLATGQAIVHEPTTQQEAARELAREKLTRESARRLFELKVELEKAPRNAELKSELKQLKHIDDHLTVVGARNVRREIWRISQAALASSLKPIQKSGRKRTRKTSKTENE
jgi:hypothetical protein